jgi:hypothetical protein
VLGFFAGHRTTVRMAATLQFASAVPLAIPSAALVSRLQFLGFGRVPGTLIALTGGILASGFLVVSAVVQWVLSRPEVAADRVVVRPLADLSFAAGGPAHVVFLGLLIAGWPCRRPSGGSCLADSRSPASRSQRSPSCPRWR